MQKYRRETLRPLRAARVAVLAPNPAIPGTLLVPLTKGYSAIIDAADAEAVSAHLWHAMVRPDNSRTVYAAKATGDQKRLHQFLWTAWGNPPTPEIDHRNGNGLDCRRENLRAATRAENAQNQGLSSANTSGAKGIRLRPSGRWEAVITVGGKQRFLGTFAERAAAIRAYDAAALAARGEFARTNEEVR
jgi:hypothetical protein